MLFLPHSLLLLLLMWGQSSAQLQERVYFTNNTMFYHRYNAKKKRLRDSQPQTTQTSVIRRLYWLYTRHELCRRLMTSWQHAITLKWLILWQQHGKISIMEFSYCERHWWECWSLLISTVTHLVFDKEWKKKKGAFKFTMAITISHSASHILR